MGKWKEKLRIIKKIINSKSKKVLIRVILAAVVLIVLITASVYTVFIKPNLSQESYVYIEEAVERGDLILGIMESGSVELQETTLDYKVETDTEDEDEDDEDDEDEDDEESVKYLEIEDVYAAAGQRIEEGEALFKLTDKSVEAVRKKLTAVLTEAKIALSEAEAEYQIELLQAKSIYDTSMLEAERAGAAYNASSVKTKESAGSLAAEIKVLESEIEACREQLAEEELWEDLEDAQTAYTSAKNIYEDTDVHNATAYASNYADYKSAKEQLESIQGQIDDLNDSIEENQKSIEKKQTELALTQSGLEVEQLTNESAYESAVLGGEQAEDIYNYTVASLEQSVKTAREEMEEAESNLEELNSFVKDDGMIYADGTGLVTTVSYSKGDDLVNTGAMLSYVKEGEYTVTIDVSEEDISAIQVGNTVDIAIASYPEEKYTGTVISITTTAASDYAATISYPVTLKIEGNTSLLYGGMTAEVTFVTDSVTDVLYVSKKAIQEENGKTYVYKKGSGGKQTLTEVETGFSDGTDIEIVSGLSDGDTIYIKSRISGSEADLMENSGGSNAAAGGESGGKEAGIKGSAGSEAGMNGSGGNEAGMNGSGGNEAGINNSGGNDASMNGSGGNESGGITGGGTGEN